MTTMPFRRLTFSIMVLCGLASPAFAEGFLCPHTSRLVEVGDSAYDVLSRCGQPTFSEEIRERRSSYQRWIYDFGDSYLIRIVTLKGGRVSRIEFGNYGSSR